MSFRLEITSFEEFAAFCAFIRGDDEKVTFMMQTLRRSATALAAAQQKAETDDALNIFTPSTNPLVGTKP